MSEEYDDNVVDLTAYRKQKEEEEAEKLRLQKEQEELEEIEYMKYVLGNIMDQLGDPSKTGSMFYIPMSDEEIMKQYFHTSGYDDNGDWYSSWETEGFNEEDYYEPEEE